jgi:drug/metabolite transporter (DMT)-like permease
MDKMAENERDLSPVIGMLAAVLAISTGSLFIRLMQAEVPPLVIALYRLGISSLILLPFALLRGDEIARLDRRQWLLLLLGSLGLALHFVTWISSLRYTSVLRSVVFVNTSPLWVAILSPIVLKEAVLRRTKIGLGLALLGMLLAAASGVVQITGGEIVWQGFQGSAGSQPILGSFLAMLGAWSATVFLMVGRKLRSNLSLLPYTFLLYGMAAVLVLGMVMLTRQPIGGYSRMTYVWLAGIALIPQLLGHSLANWALKYASAAYVAVLLLGEPVGASLLALIFLREVPGAVEMIGAGVILAGIYVVTKNGGQSIRD